MTFNQNIIQEVEKFILKGRYEEAQEKLGLIDDSFVITEEGKLQKLYLYSLLMILMGKFKEGKNLSEQLMASSKEIKNYTKEFDALINLSTNHQANGNRKESWRYLEKAEQVQQSLPKSGSTDTLIREMILFYRKGSLLQYEGKRQDAIKYFEKSKQTIKIGSEVIDSFQFKLFYPNMLLKLGRTYDFSDDNQKAKTCGSIALNLFIDQGDRKGMSLCYYLLGDVSLELAEHNQAIDYYQKMYDLNKHDLKNQEQAASALLSLGIAFHRRGELYTAEDYYQKAFDIGEKNNLSWMRGFLANLGNLYAQRGEFDRALKYLDKGQAGFEAIPEKERPFHHLAYIYCIKGQIFGAKGELKAAREALNTGIELAKQSTFQRTSTILASYYLLIQLITTFGPFNEKDEHFEQFEILYNELINQKDIIPTLMISQGYRQVRGLMLKGSNRLSDQFEALKLFKQIVDEKICWIELTIDALVNVCELLITEFRMTGNEEIFTELKGYTKKLLAIANDQGSSLILAKAYWLESKIALLDLNLQYAQNLMVKAQELADSKGFHLLADVIDNEHYSFFTQLEKWQEYLEKDVPYKQRIELAQLENLVVKMIYHQGGDTPIKTIDELQMIEYRNYIKQVKELFAEEL